MSLYYSTELIVRGLYLSECQSRGLSSLFPLFWYINLVQIYKVFLN